ncbi:MAG: SDR family oxidoreductase [Gammaproteobacteria bacterium]|nr:SDR family oxidoreductase [Gammaproteobacteria bacterium]
MTKPSSILITGCSSGIGLNAAQTLHNLGYQVFATARTAAAVSELSKLGLNALQLDITSDQQIDAVFDQILEQTGGTLDAVFNNAAYGQPGAIEDLSTAVLKEQFATNVFAWHAITRKALAVMRAQGHGRIIQNSSILGLVSMPFRGAYNASKYAIEGLTDTLRLELSGTQIYVSLIEPGPIESNFRANALAKFKANIDIQNSVFRDHYQQQLERLGKDIANQFTLPPDAVTKRLLHALRAKKPKARYYVTTPTYLFTFLKRVLPTTWLDKLLVKG